MIGIFDSGVGGMTVARAVETLLPDLQIIILWRPGQDSLWKQEP